MGHLRRAKAGPPGSRGLLRCECGGFFRAKLREKHLLTVGHKQRMNRQDVRDRGLMHIDRTGAKFLDQAQLALVHWAATAIGYEIVPDASTGRSKCVRCLIDEAWVTRSAYLAWNLTSSIGLRRDARVKAIQAILDQGQPLLEAYHAYLELGGDVPTSLPGSFRIHRPDPRADAAYKRKFWQGLAKSM